jgi:hypothetical protein
MTVKRNPDPAGLLPDHVKVEFGGPSEFDAERAAVWEILNAASPGGRIDRIASAPNMADEAAALRARLGPNGTANDSLLLDIAGAEHRALYARAAPGVIANRKTGRQRKDAGFSSGQERAAERKPSWDQWQAEADRQRAENPHLSKSRVAEIVATKFGVTRQAVVKRITIVATDRPRCKK